MVAGRAIAPALLAFSTLACGTIVSGEDLLPEDAGTSDVPDVGPRDMGPPPDLGCRDITPAASTEWPFPHTKQAYLDRFYDAIPNIASCGQLGACHSDEAMSRPPRIPDAVDAVMLDDQPFLDAAITQLWSSMQPKTYTLPSPPSSGPVIGLEWIHDPAGGNITQQYSMEQLTAVKALMRQAEPCKWKPAYDRQMAGQFNCTGGTPPPDGGPPSDAQVSDAQASDGGDAGDGGDVGPQDAGQLSGFCDCPVPKNLNFQYCR